MKKQNLLLLGSAIFAINLVSVSAPLSNNAMQPNMQANTQSNNSYSPPSPPIKTYGVPESLSQTPGSTPMNENTNATTNNTNPPLVIKMSPQDKMIIDLERKIIEEQQEAQYWQNEMEMQMEEMESAVYQKSLEMQWEQYEKQEKFNQKIPYAIIDIPGSGVVGNVILTNGIALPTPAELLNSVVYVENNTPYISGNPTGIYYQILGTQVQNTSTFGSMPMGSGAGNSGGYGSSDSYGGYGGYGSYGGYGGGSNLPPPPPPASPPPPMR